ncbi:arylformamidase [Comamonas odontotermitis]|uniref:Arylformamidase n=1 Tax=Comamonas odontotermitis TaxID=379895 RepID=A0ABR6RC81_9BURK|nr:alpha/beta hydrolase [Comamonas odontotermitis]MBB6576770.1 arylformamidase [Comamonas odontotermitis]
MRAEQAVAVAISPPRLYRDFESQTQIDAAYDPLRPVADPVAARQHFVQRSALARAQLRCELDIAFGATLAETLDIFPAPGGAAAPVFIFFHGGYWRANTSKEFSCVAWGPQALGFCTVVVNYALCPQVGIDEIVRQCRASLAWVFRHIEAYGGDPGRVVVGGHSAGGQLGAMCLQTPWARDYGLPDDPLRGALLISGIYDIAPLRYSYLQPLIQLDEGVIVRNSPAFGARSCATPIHLVWGEREQSEFERQSLLMHAAWQAVGNVSGHAALPGCDHFSVLHGLEDPQSDLCQQLVRLSA